MTFFTAFEKINVCNQNLKEAEDSLVDGMGWDEHKIQEKNEMIE